MDNNYFKKLNILISILGEADYKYPHPEMAFYCPKCKHRKKKLMVHIEQNVFKCWVCQPRFSGYVNKLIKMYGTVSQLIEWKSLFNDNSLIELDIKDAIENSLTSPKIEVNNSIIQLPSEFKDISNDLTFNPYRNYLLSRGINDKLIKKYQIKYCDEGQYSSRVIIPSFDSSANINFFIARSIYNHGMKYLNPPMNKNSIIFNELFIDWNSPIILVEGVFDALKIDYNSIPLLGSSLDGLLYDKILENKPILYMMLDNDAYSKQLDIISSLLSRNIKIFNVKISKKDPGCMNRNEIFDSLKTAKKINETELIKEKLEI